MCIVCRNSVYCTLYSVHMYVSYCIYPMCIVHCTTVHSVHGQSSLMQEKYRSGQKLLGESLVHLPYWSTVLAETCTVTTKRDKQSTFTRIKNINFLHWSGLINQNIRIITHIEFSSPIRSLNSLVKTTFLNINNPFVCIQPFKYRTLIEV